MKEFCRGLYAGFEILIQSIGSISTSKIHILFSLQTYPDQGSLNQRRSRWNFYSCKLCMCTGTSVRQMATSAVSTAPSSRYPLLVWPLINRTQITVISERFIGIRFKLLIKARNFLLKIATHNNATVTLTFFCKTSIFLTLENKIEYVLISNWTVEFPFLSFIRVNSFADSSKQVS